MSDLSTNPDHPPVVGVFFSARMKADRWSRHSAIGWSFDQGQAKCLLIRNVSQSDANPEFNRSKFTEPPQSVYARGGRHVEFGVAVSSGKRLIVIGYRENVFHWLPQIEFYERWEDFIRKLTN